MRVFGALRFLFQFDGGDLMFLGACWEIIEWCGLNVII